MNQKLDFMIIDRNNCVTHSIRMYGNFICQMDLTNFPQDFQYCSIEIISCKLFKEKKLLNSKINLRFTNSQTKAVNFKLLI